MSTHQVLEGFAIGSSRSPNPRQLREQTKLKKLEKLSILLLAIGEVQTIVDFVSSLD